MPLVLGAVVIVYQLGIALIIHDNLGDEAHFIVEILFFATVGPAAVYWALTRVSVWLEERQQLEEKIRTNENRLASLMAASADAILSLNRDFEIDSWNRGAELIFGFSREEIVGSKFVRLLRGREAPEVELRWLADTVERTGFVRGYETVGRTSSGQIVDVELTATQLTEDRSEPGSMSVILRDITDRKRREQEIANLNARLNQLVKDRTQELAEKVDQLAQANLDLQSLDQVRSDFVSIVSHQIRAPLTNMQGAVERMRADCPAITQTCGRMFAILQQQIARLDALVREMLSAARIEAGQVAIHAEPTSIVPVVKDIVEQVQARSPQRKFRIIDKPGLPPVLADRDRLTEVLANLIDNADKYSAPTSTIGIVVWASQSDVTVSVLDSGPGLPDVDPDRLFDKFYRAERGDSQPAYGHGLGLYVCRKLIEAQGGRIWAEGRSTGGAAFSFALPVWRGADA
ncbi:MAG: hypothetical protein BMS9Abin28_1656 [Anaerolineae bacterium]|nr:MAG: hypothetical protein BMS9Abin28_1656 [Anaerolineae bacterium]